MAIIIKGTGTALPVKTVTNEELAGIVDTSDEWIRERTGIIQRHIATGDTTASLAIQAAKLALKDAGVSAEKVDLILVASCTAEMAFPCIACQVQGAIGAANAAAFDLNAACTGFLYAMNTADAYIASGTYQNALVIGAEVLSNVVDWTDRGSCILFGDGAGAVYFEKDAAHSEPMMMIQRSDGSKGSVLAGRQRKQSSAFYRGDDASMFLTMDGREVFKFATRKVPEAIQELLAKAELTANDIDLYILHQANYRIIENIAKRLGVALERFPSNVSEVGNTSSASIPILLDMIIKEGRMKEGMKVILSGFGAGLTYSACLMKV